MGDDALSVAHEAKNLAIRAMTQVEMMQPQLTNISSGIEAMRRENSDQHRENARINKEAFNEVHTRISSVKQDLTRKNEKTESRWFKWKDKIFWVMAALLIGLLGQKLGIHLEFPQ